MKENLKTFFLISSNKIVVDGILSYLLLIINNILEVPQGSVTTPTLFFIYIDDVTIVL